MRFIKRESRKGIELDLAPLIDVLFNMIIFLVIAAGFIKPGISLQLPDVSGREKMEKGDIIISVDHNSTVYVDEEAVEIGKLAGVIYSRLGQGLNGGKKRVVFYGDESIPYRTFVKIVDVIKSSGADEISIAHE